jgi:putative hydrolase of the HAD superfamily
MFKAILFDMVGVLVFKKENYIPRTTDEMNAENIGKLFNHLDDQKLIKDAKEKLELNDEEIDRAVKLIPEKYKKFEELWKKLPEIKKHYKIAVINNGNAVALKYWKEKFNFSNFDLFINSAEEKIKKPDPKIFLLACGRLGVKPEECLFMDDSLENIESAQKLGMKTIWWNKDTDKDLLLQDFLNEVFRTACNTVFALIFLKNKILLFHRDNKIDIPYPDYWHLPGGRMEKNETPTKAMKRELEEEITHVPREIRCIGKFRKDDGKLSYTFLCIVSKNEAKLFKLGSSEGQEIKFFAIKEIPKLKLTNALKLRLSKYKKLIQTYEH